MTPKKSVFDDGTGAHTTTWEPGPYENGGIPYYYDPSGNPNLHIDPRNECWDRVLRAAQQQYGDPHIHYGVGPKGGRQLQFGDNTALPTDGTVIYHTPKGNWIRYDNGQYGPADANFHPSGTPFSPAGYKMANGNYFPINSHGEQIGAQSNELPHPNGWHVHDNIWTPENANGDYYEIGPDGKRTYHHKDGSASTQAEYDHSAPTPSPAPHGRPPSEWTVPTEEENSGATAVAAKSLEDNLKDTNDKTLDADKKLAESLLAAHSTTAAGRAALNDIQRDVDEFVKNHPLDTQMARDEFKRFIKAKLDKITEVITTAQLDAQSQKDALIALAYAGMNQPGDGAGGGTGGGANQQPGAPAASPLGQQQASPGDLGGDFAGDTGGDLGGDLGADTGGDLGSALGGLAPGALSGLSQIPAAAAGIPAAAAGIPAGIGSMLGGGGLGNPGGGLFDSPKNGRHHDGDSASNDDLMSALGDSAFDPPSDDKDGAGEDKHNNDNPIDQKPGTVANPLAPGASQLPTALGGTTTVTLPDGSTATAETRQLAAAMEDIKAGKSPAEAFSKAGMILPPTNTAPATPVDPSQLRLGSYATYANGDIVVAVSPQKVLIDGHLEPISAAAKPGFLGWNPPPQPAQTNSIPIPTLTTSTPAAPSALTPTSAPH